MANIKHTMQATLHKLYRQGKGQRKKDDPGKKYIHSRCTLNVYLKETDRFARWLREMGVKSRCSEEEAAAHVQTYIDHLVQKGKSENTVHVAAAAVCKALRLRLASYEKPRRTSAPRKGRRTAPSLAGRRDADTANEEHRRLVEFASRVGIRRSEYADLRGRDFLKIGGYSYVVVEQGKGGKRQLQRIDPEDADFVASYFEGRAPDALVFSVQEMKNKLNLHALRREHAQAMYRRYVSRLETDPAYRSQLLTEIKDAFRRGGQDWKKNPDMRRLGRPYVCRGNVRRSMADNQRAVTYDRLALLAVSVFHLAHWRVNVTVEHYFR